MCHQSTVTGSPPEPADAGASDGAAADGAAADGADETLLHRHGPRSRLLRSPEGPRSEHGFSWPSLLVVPEHVTARERAWWAMTSPPMRSSAHSVVAGRVHLRDPAPPGRRSLAGRNRRSATSTMPVIGRTPLGRGPPRKLRSSVRYFRRGQCRRVVRQCQSGVLDLSVGSRMCRTGRNPSRRNFRCTLLFATLRPWPRPVRPVPVIPRPRRSPISPS